jgi:hypothetical protein
VQSRVSLLEKDSLLWIHGCCLGRRDAKAAIVEERSAKNHATVPHAAGNRLRRHGKHIRTPPFLRHFANGVERALQHTPHACIQWQPRGTSLKRQFSSFSHLDMPR